MKHLALLLAVLLGASGASAQPDLIARIHFLGGNRVATEPSHSAFSNEFCSVQAKALESQVLDKLARTPGTWFKAKIPAGAGNGVAQLRPLLDDLLKSEWIFEMRDAPGSPEYALAIRLDNARAQLWQNNLKSLLEAWTKLPIEKIQNGWQLKKHEPPNLFQFRRSGDWVVVDCGQDKLSLAGEILPASAKPAAAETGWLTANLDWPRLAQIFPKLAVFDFPKIQMRFFGRNRDLFAVGKFTLEHPLPPLEPWRMPTNIIHQPLVSFTAARSVGPWLARQSWMAPARLQPQPNQLFIWALAASPFQTFAAEPVPDGHAALVQLDRNLSADISWKSRFISPPKVVLTNNEISFRNLPFVAPFIEAVREPGGDFLFGGFFPNVPKSTPLPPQLFEQLKQPGLVYYHWEVTGARLGKKPHLQLVELSQLLLTLTHHQQLEAKSPAFDWLNFIGPTLGESVTTVTENSPNVLTFKRRASAGLTALELVALANWIEAPNFPGCNLRLPPRPVKH